MVQVIKRDGHHEAFNADKLRLAFWRAMGGQWKYFMAAHHFSRAIEIYLVRRRMEAVSSGALFEMALMTLRRCDCPWVAGRLEEDRVLRRLARERTILLDSDGAQRPWRRQWLTDAIVRRWDISSSAARAVSAELERELIFHMDILDSEAVLDAADERIEHLGLAPWCLMACLPGGRETPQQH